MFASKRFNKRYLLTLVALFSLFWLPVVMWVATGGAVLSGAEDSGRSIPVAGFLYYALVTLPAFFLSLFALIYAPIGIVRNAGLRLLHVGQFLVAVVLLAPLIVGIFFVAIFWGGGPG